MLPWPYSTKDMVVPSKPSVSTQRLYYLLFLVPFIWQLGLAPYANAVTWQPFGLPFQMVWQMTGIVLTSFILFFIYRLDLARDRAQSQSTAVSGTDQ